MRFCTLVILSFLLGGGTCHAQLVKRAAEKAAKNAAKSPRAPVGRAAGLEAGQTLTGEAARIYNPKNNASQEHFIQELQAISEEYNVHFKNRATRQTPWVPRRLENAELAAWLTQKKSGNVQRFFDKNKAVQNIVDKAPGFSVGLNQIRQMQRKFGKQDFYELFMMKMYIKYFGFTTRHHQQFFKHIAQLNNPGIENRTAKRMDFLAKYQTQFRREFSFSSIPQHQHVYYLQDVAQITPATFNEKLLVLAKEKELSPLPNLNEIRQIHIPAQFTFESNIFSVYKFYPLQQLHALYRFLITNGKKEAIDVVLNTRYQTLYIYNKAHTRWVRVSAHEYEDPAQLHIHVNEIQNWTVTLPGGKTSQEKILDIVTIPVSSARWATPLTLEDFFIFAPLRALEKDPLVTVYKH